MSPVVVKLVLVIVLVLMAEDEFRAAVAFRISRNVRYKLRCSSARVTLDDDEDDMSENPICL